MIERPAPSEEILSGAQKAIRMHRAHKLAPPKDDRYILLKKYEGVVVSHDESGFVARVTENRNDHSIVEAEIGLDELSETDREMVREGAPFVWTIGYRYEGSTRKRESMIYFRRLPAWTDAEIEQANKATEELINAIRWD